ncbi:hypothetical protein [Mesorhizobium sp. J428]|nr:hypothetical protein [Mesorhizobium sp. J428]
MVTVVAHRGAAPVTKKQNGRPEAAAVLLVTDLAGDRAATVTNG